MNNIQRHYFNQFIGTTRPKTIYDEYINPSPHKKLKWERISAFCNEVKGFHLTILSYDYHGFTCAFAFERNGTVSVVVFTQDVNQVITVSSEYFYSLEPVKKWGEDNA